MIITCGQQMRKFVGTESIFQILQVEFNFEGHLIFQGNTS